MEQQQEYLGTRMGDLMRAELGKGARSIVFVWQAMTIADDEVRVYIYDGMVKSCTETYNMGRARGYWRSLVSKGYVVIPAKSRAMRP